MPIGPVYVIHEETDGRQVLEKSPDTAEIRAKLLEIVAEIEETPRVEYPTPTKFDEEVIRQLKEFNEERAVTELRRISRFNPLALPHGDNPFGRNRATTVALAIEALASIKEDGALDEIEYVLRQKDKPIDEISDLTVGRQPLLRRLFSRKQKDCQEPSGQTLAGVRLCAVLAVRHCRSDRARELLRRVISDPDSKVAESAKKVLDTLEAAT